MQTVLVVDDDPVFRTQLGAALKAAGYRVVDASDGNDAIEFLKEHHPEISLAVVDLVLPGTDGFQLIDLLHRRTSAKVIATTGRLRQTFLDTCKYLGADAALTKPRPDQPFSGEAWLNAVREVLGPQAGSSGA